MVDADVLDGFVRAQFPNARVEVRGGDARYEVFIGSEACRDLSRVKRQQLVYGCLTDHIKDGSVHAVTIQAKTPDEV